MVAATANVDSSRSESLADDSLIAEIAPAMLEKLKGDGRQTTNWVSLTVFAGGGIFFGAFQHFYGIQYPDIPFIVFAAACLGSIACKLALPRWLARRNIRQELTYRRQHGKWRWDH